MAKKSSVSSRPAQLKSMKSEDIAARQWTETELQAVRTVGLRQAAKRSAPVTPGFAGLTPKQLDAMVRLRDVRPPKIAVSLRLDANVVAWLKSKGKGHLTRINDILTNLMEAESHQRA